MERHGDGVAAPGHAAPEQPLPDYVAPEQAAPDHLVPEQAIPEQAAPEQAVPDYMPPAQAAPERTAPGGAGTGDARVDEALARLGDLDGLPVDEHPAVFEHVHRDLTAALGALDSGPEDPSATSGTRGTSVGPTTPGS
jgi:hypothetical protein